MADGIQENIYAADTDTEGLRVQGIDAEQIHRGGYIQTPAVRTLGSHSPWNNWPIEPGVDRVVNGIPNRMDRCKSLGNAVVPQQFYIFFKLIADIEQGVMR